MTSDGSRPLGPHNLPEGDDWGVDLLLRFFSFLSRFLFLLLDLLDLFDILLYHLFELGRVSFHFTKRQNTSPDAIDGLSNGGSVKLLIFIWDG